MEFKALLYIISIIVSTGFYDLSLTTINDDKVVMDNLKGKKIAIGVIDSRLPDSTFVSFLDSLQNAKQGLQVILLPANDLSNGLEIESGKVAYTKARSNMVILKPMAIQSNTKQRGDLISWLTSVEHNSHFQIDAVSANSLFIISSDGDLRSVFNAGFTVKALADAIH
jgi:glutathione peroxidase-family protein